MTWVYLENSADAAILCDSKFQHVSIGQEHIGCINILPEIESQTRNYENINKRSMSYCDSTSNETRGWNVAQFMPQLNQF